MVLSDQVNVPRWLGPLFSVDVTQLRIELPQLLPTVMVRDLTAGDTCKANVEVQVHCRINSNRIVNVLSRQINITFVAEYQWVDDYSLDRYGRS